MQDRKTNNDLESKEALPDQLQQAKADLVEIWDKLQPLRPGGYEEPYANDEQTIRTLLKDEKDEKLRIALDNRNPFLLTMEQHKNLVSVLSVMIQIVDDITGGLEVKSPDSRKKMPLQMKDFCCNFYVKFTACENKRSILLTKKIEIPIHVEAHVNNLMRDQKGCDLFLMLPDQFNHNPPPDRISDRNYLYLYKDNAEKFYYKMQKDKPISLDDEETKKTLKDAKFSEDANRCLNKSICQIILKKTSQRNHTQAYNEQKTVDKVLGTLLATCILNALVKPFINSYRGIVSYQQEFKDEIEPMQKFAEKLSGNCLDMRTQEAIGYALSGDYKKLTFSELLADATKKCHQDKQDKYFYLLAMLMKEYWGKKYRKDNADTATCQEAGKLGVDKHQFIFDGFQQSLDGGLIVNNDFIFVYHELPESLRLDFIQLVIKALEKNIPDDPDNKMFLHSFKINNEIEQKKFNTLLVGSCSGKHLLHYIAIECKAEVVAQQFIMNVSPATVEGPLAEVWYDLYPETIAKLEEDLIVAMERYHQKGHLPIMLDHIKQLSDRLQGLTPNQIIKYVNYTRLLTEAAENAGLMRAVLRELKKYLEPTQFLQLIHQSRFIADRLKLDIQTHPALKILVSEMLPILQQVELKDDKDSQMIFNTILKTPVDLDQRKTALFGHFLLEKTTLLGYYLLEEKSVGNVLINKASISVLVDTLIKTRPMKSTILNPVSTLLQKKEKEKENLLTVLKSNNPFSTKFLKLAEFNETFKLLVPMLDPINLINLIKAANIPMTFKVFDVFLKILMDSYKDPSHRLLLFQEGSILSKILENKPDEQEQVRYKRVSRVLPILLDHKGTDEAKKMVKDILQTRITCSAKDQMSVTTNLLGYFIIHNEKSFILKNLQKNFILTDIICFIEKTELHKNKKDESLANKVVPYLIKCTPESTQEEAKGIFNKEEAQKAFDKLASVFLHDVFKNLSKEKDQVDFINKVSPQTLIDFLSEPDHSLELPKFFIIFDCIFKNLTSEKEIRESLSSIYLECYYKENDFPLLMKFFNEKFLCLADMICFIEKTKLFENKNDENLANKIISYLIKFTPESTQEEAKHVFDKEEAQKSFDKLASVFLHDVFNSLSEEKNQIDFINKVSPQTLIDFLHHSDRLLLGGSRFFIIFDRIYEKLTPVEINQYLNPAYLKCYFNKNDFPLLMEFLNKKGLCNKLNELIRDQGSNLLAEINADINDLAFYVDILNKYYSSYEVICMLSVPTLISEKKAEETEESRNERINILLPILLKFVNEMQAEEKDDETIKRKEILLNAALKTKIIYFKDGQNINTDLLGYFILRFKDNSANKGMCLSFIDSLSSGTLCGMLKEKILNGSFIFSVDTIIPDEILSKALERLETDRILHLLWNNNLIEEYKAFIGKFLFDKFKNCDPSKLSKLMWDIWEHSSFDQFLDIISGVLGISAKQSFSEEKENKKIKNISSSQLDNNDINNLLVYTRKWPEHGDLSLFEYLCIAYWRHEPTQIAKLLNFITSDNLQKQRFYSPLLAPECLDIIAKKLITESKGISPNKSNLLTFIKKGIPVCTPIFNFDRFANCDFEKALTYYVVKEFLITIDDLVEEKAKPYEVCAILAALSEKHGATYLKKQIKKMFPADQLIMIEKLNTLTDDNSKKRRLFKALLCGVAEIKSEENENHIQFLYQFFDKIPKSSNTLSFYCCLDIIAKKLITHSEEKLSNNSNLVKFIKKGLPVYIPEFTFNCFDNCNFVAALQYYGREFKIRVNDLVEEKAHPYEVCAILAALPEQDDAIYLQEQIKKMSTENQLTMIKKLNSLYDISKKQRLFRAILNGVAKIESKNNEIQNQFLIEFFLESNNNNDEIRNLFDNNSEEMNRVFCQLMVGTPLYRNNKDDSIRMAHLERLDRYIMSLSSREGCSDRIILAHKAKAVILVDSKPNINYLDQVIKLDRETIPKEDFFRHGRLAKICENIKDSNNKGKIILLCFLFLLSLGLIFSGVGSLIGILSLGVTLSVGIPLSISLLSVGGVMAVPPLYRFFEKLHDFVLVKLFPLKKSYTIREDVEDNPLPPVKADESGIKKSNYNQKTIIKKLKVDFRKNLDFIEEDKKIQQPQSQLDFEKVNQDKIILSEVQPNTKERSTSVTGFSILTNPLQPQFSRDSQNLNNQSIYRTVT